MRASGEPSEREAGLSRAGGGSVVRHKEANEGDCGDQRGDHVARHAPLADSVDDGELDREQVRAESEGRQRKCSVGETPPLSARERCGKQSGIAGDAEGRHRNPEHDRIRRALNGAAATCRAESGAHRSTAPAGGMR